MFQLNSTAIEKTTERPLFTQTKTMQQKAPKLYISAIQTANIPSSQNSKMFSFHHHGNTAHFMSIPEESVVSEALTFCSPKKTRRKGKSPK